MLPQSMESYSIILFASVNRYRTVNSLFTSTCSLLVLLHLSVLLPTVSQATSPLALIFLKAFCLLEWVGTENISRYQCLQKVRDYPTGSSLTFEMT